MLLARLQQRQPGCPFSRETGEMEENDEGRRADRCVLCPGRDGKGAECTRDCVWGTRSASPGCSANNPSLHTHAEPPGKGLGGEGAALPCGEGAGESLDFVHSIAETPALLLPHTSGGREGGRAGWTERGTDRGAGVGLPHSACAGGARVRGR